MSESTLIKIILSIFGLLIFFIAVIALLRLLLNLIIFFSSKKYKKSKKSQKNKYLNKKNFIKEDEELLKYKDEIPKAHSQVRANKISIDRQKNYEILNQQEELEDEYIVGISEPLGFWTRKVFGERIATIMAQVESMKKGESTKFWQNFVKASRYYSQQHNHFR